MIREEGISLKEKSDREGRDAAGDGATSPLVKAFRSYLVTLRKGNQLDEAQERTGQKSFV